jgi:hypothetical protein
MNMCCSSLLLSYLERSYLSAGLVSWFLDVLQQIQELKCQELSSPVCLGISQYRDEVPIVADNDSIQHRTRIQSNKPNEQKVALNVAPPDSSR